MIIGEDTKVSFINDVKNSKVKEANLFIEACICALGIVGIFLVLFVLVFSKELISLVN